jgi:hypothetical protein
MMKSLAVYLVSLMLATPPLFAQSAAKPPIDLKYVGIVKRRAPSPPLAVIVNAQGRRCLLAAGDLLEGRYRILRVDENEIQVAYVDGTGQRTIRLTSQRRQ